MNLSEQTHRIKKMMGLATKEGTKNLKESKKYVTYEMNKDSFARLFLSFLNEIRQNDGFSRSKMKYALDRTLRAWTDRPPEIISKRVIDYMIIHHPNVNPFTARFRPRNRFGINVIFEHTTPVNTFLKKLLDSNTLEDVKNAMNEYTGMCIITLEEDRCLSSKGLSRQRPQGWQQAYASCDIQIMNEGEYKIYKQEKLNSSNHERID